MTIFRQTALFSLVAIGACSSTTTADTIETAQFASSLHVDLAASTRLPGGMYERDLVAGTGPIVAAGQSISVRYSGYLVDGTEFDSVPPTAAPVSFPIGVAVVIKGWDEGLVGARVGTTRQLIIPSDLAYGAAGRPPRIGPNAILVFTIEIDGAQ